MRYIIRVFLRGDIYYADLERGVDSEQEGYLPVVIIQNNVGNKHSPTVIVATITSQKSGKERPPTHYYVGTDCDLYRQSVIMLEQLHIVDKRRLDKKCLSGLDYALAVSLDLTQYNFDALIMSLYGVCTDNFRNAGAYFLRLVAPSQTKCRKLLPTLQTGLE